MSSVGPGVCRQCRHEVLYLPVASGQLHVFDPGEYPIGDVDPQDRYVVLPHGSVITLTAAGTEPGTCLRRHHCTPPEDPAPVERRPHPRLADRTDYEALRALQSVASLLRSQTRGTLRQHPGSRHYSPVRISAELARLTHLDEHHCVLCRRSFDGTPTLLVATVDNHPDAETSLHVCMPQCPQPHGDRPRA